MLLRNSVGQFDVVTFDHNEPQWIEKLSLYRDQIVHEYQNRDRHMIDNYSTENFDISQWPVFSVVEHESKILAFSSVFDKNEYYPENSARCLSRFFLGQEVRSYLHQGKLASLPRRPVIGRQMLLHQIDFCRQQGVQLVFVSKEYPQRRWCQHFAKFLNETTDYNWTVGDDLAAVCYDKSPRCWQHILYTHLDENIDSYPFNKRITENEYNIRFSGELDFR